ncbi:MAG TPA: 3-isopropylmalate dehydratase large subunit [Gammaproteobacteria bacterium]|nr:3-isopropylmalate dehydratase large subunit [Gammaproteobacteria bacterium]
MIPQTLYDKIFANHVVHQMDDQTFLLYIDCQLLHEVTSAQAFANLRLKQRKLWSPTANIAVPDHNIPTIERFTIQDAIAKQQILKLTENCKENGILLFDLADHRQGIVHIIGPEQGITLPGMTIVCGDSHTSTHGALGTIAMGIGTSEVEQVLATQCLIIKKPKNMRVLFEGSMPRGVYAKDLILALIGKMGTQGGTGFAIEYSGGVISDFSVEERMTLCNMSIEAGAPCGLTAVDETTLQYIKGKPFAPKEHLWQQAIQSWKKLKSDRGAYFDKEVRFFVSDLAPQVTWGTSPDMVVGINQKIPDPEQEPNLIKREHMNRALKYMGLKPALPVTQIPLEKIFIGSCTNARIEDLRVAASILKGHKISKKIKQALVVPGSGLIKKQAEEEGLDQIFKESGFEWRDPGCSMCLGMNPDRLSPGEHCASTSNRNFESRQGLGGRTHLCSPAMAAAASIAGHFIDIKE